MQRTCTCCGKTKPLEEYRFNTKTGRYSLRCVDCGQTANSTNRYAYTSMRSMLTRRLAHARTNQRRFEFELDIEFLMDMLQRQDGRCALSGVEMTFSHDTPSSNASIDRIDNNCGYMNDNVRLVCSAVNLMRNRMSDEELVWWASAIVKGRASAN